jgi:hypothetical protein
MSALDPGQREHELATVLIAVSRFGSDNKRARLTAARLTTMTNITAEIVGEVTARITQIAGKAAARKFRRDISTAMTTALARPQPGRRRYPSAATTGAITNELL